MMIYDQKILLPPLKCWKIISRLKSQVQDVLDSDAVLESMSEAEKQVTLAKAKLVKNIPAITASLKLLIEIMIWITVSFTALWTMQKIALRREFNRQLGKLNYSHRWVKRAVPDNVWARKTERLKWIALQTIFYRGLTLECNIWFRVQSHKIVTFGPGLNHIRLQHF